MPDKRRHRSPTAGPGKLVQAKRRLHVSNVLVNECGGGRRVARKRLLEDEEDKSPYRAERWYEWEGY